MATIQEVTKKCFKSTYEFIETTFADNEDLLGDLMVAVFTAERNMMLELIKREAVEQVLTDRVMLYVLEGEAVEDELHGAL